MILLLALWYMIDGTGELLDAPRRAYDAIYAPDGYHPILDPSSNWEGIHDLKFF
ncbi:hypothetical protein B0H13DRAFT_2357346 [Mycena leptocephala]|nr:hypothetical protein B0H13DRAFT_2357346 [Mycena leptocephala]